MAAAICSVVRLGSAKRRLSPLRNSTKKIAIVQAMSAEPATEASSGIRPEALPRKSASTTSSEVPAAIR